MAEYPSNPGPLPARDFCNSWGDGNPVLGKGALGNPDKKHMYYTGSDREKQVITVQTMLQELGYDVGAAGSDGKFGNNTEKAVMAFQQDHRDWNGEGLKVDGLVGPETADALNRMMVGRWYDQYQTPPELVGGKAYHSVTPKILAKNFSITTGDAEKVKIFLMNKSAGYGDVVKIKLIDHERQPLKNTHYRLEIDEESFSPVEGETDTEGILSELIPKKAMTGRLILDICVFDLVILPKLDPAGEFTGALVRLSNLGYPVDIPDEYSESQSIGQEPDISQQFKVALLEFQQDNNLSPSGSLDNETVNKLDDVYG